MPTAETSVNPVSNKPTNKTKYSKTTQKCIHTHTHTMESVLCWPTTYSWAHSLSWGVVDIPNDTPLERTDCPLPASPN